MRFLKEFYNTNQRILIPLAYSVLWFIGVWIALFGDKFIIPKDSDCLHKSLYCIMLSFAIFLSEVSVAFFDIGFSDYKRAFNVKIFRHFGVITIDIVIAFVLGMVLIKSKIVSIMLYITVMLSVIKYTSSYMTKNKDVYFDKDRSSSYKSNDIG